MSTTQNSASSYSIRSGTSYFLHVIGRDRLNKIFRFLCLQYFSNAFVMDIKKLSVSVRAIGDIEDLQFFFSKKGLCHA